MNLAKALSDMKAKLSRATQTVEHELAALRQRISETRKARDHARRAPRPVEEIIANRIPEAVASAATIWLREWGSILVHSERALGAPTSGWVSLPWTYGAPVPWGALCAGCPDLATEILTGLVRQVEYQPGPASSERPAVVAQLEAELAEMEAAEESMVDAMREHGLTVEHRPEVKQRREEERSRREREEQAVRFRVARETAINRAHAERAAEPGGGPSPYLEAIAAERRAVRGE